MEVHPARKEPRRNAESEFPSVTVPILARKRSKLFITYEDRITT
jgi:hypothetical protein